MENLDIINFSEFSSHKKKKKNAKKEQFQPTVEIPKSNNEESKIEELNQNLTNGSQQAHSQNRGALFTYEMLYNRAYNIHKATHGDGPKQIEINIKNPNLLQLQGNRLSWHNFRQICDQLNRDLDHVSLYFLTELGAEGYLSEGRLILKERYKRDKIQGIIKKYINEYVRCL